MKISNRLPTLFLLLILAGTTLQDSVSAGIYEQDDYSMILRDSIKYPPLCQAFQITFADAGSSGDTIKLLFQIAGLYYGIPNYTLIITVTQDKDYTDFIDVYGNDVKTKWLAQTLFIKLRRVFTSGYTYQADVTVSVNMLNFAKAMVNQADSIIKDAEQKTKELGIYLPIDSYQTRLKDAEANYNAGYYCDAIQIASEVLEMVDSDLKLSFEAYNKIRDAESALDQAKKLGYESTNQYKSAQYKIRDAWDYYYQAKWQNAISAAEKALSYLNELIQDYVEAQKKVSEAREYIQNITDKYTDPPIILKEAKNYLSYAEDNLQAGKFALAKDYAEKAIESAKSIEAAYVKAINARNSAKEKMNSAEIQNPGICLKDANSFMTRGNNALRVGKYDEAYGYYIQIPEKVNRIVKFYKEIKMEMEHVRTIILDYEAKGYKMGKANETYNKGLSALNSCDYENAYTLFQNAELQANETYKTAKEVEGTLNEIDNLLNKIKTLGVNTERYESQRSEVVSYYISGDYVTALQKARALLEVINTEYNGIIEVYNEIKVTEQDIRDMKQKLQELVDSAKLNAKVEFSDKIYSKLKLAQEEFKKGNYKLAKQYSEEALQQANSEYHKQVKLINKIREYEKTSEENINNAKRYLQAVRSSMFYKAFRTPEVVTSIKKVKENIQKAEELLSKEAELKSQGASLIEIAKLAEKANEFATQAEAIATDPDQDGIPSYNDQIALLPTSYIIGGVIDGALLLLGILLLKVFSRRL